MAKSYIIFWCLRTCSSFWVFFSIKKVFSEKTQVQHWSAPSEKISTHFDSKEKGRTRYFFRSESLLCAHYIHGLTRQKMTFDHIDGQKKAHFSTILFCSFEIGHWWNHVVKNWNFLSRWKMNSKNVSKYLIICDLHLLLFSTQIIRNFSFDKKLLEFRAQIN